MNEILISVQNVSKYFHINDEFQKNFRELLMSCLKYRKPGINRHMSHSFCALRDISFEMKRGESIGIIGRNGAGKSTLLKIIAGITPPSEGRIEIKGKLASILDIGTGFHPDLSGRDNIYLSASLLGMNKQEINLNFDKILTFSGIPDFIDTPVKYYSSGMYVRLAFAVAAHVHADILLFDEIISVGDAEFKMRCLEKINELKNKGATILLVSHSFNDVVKFCDQAILMVNGQISAMGDPQETIIRYVETILNQSGEGISRLEKTETDTQIQTTGQADEEPHTNFKQWDEKDHPPGNDYIRILKITVSADNPAEKGSITTDDEIKIDIKYRQMMDNTCIDIAFVLQDESMNRIFAGSPALSDMMLSTVSPGYYSAECTIPKKFLNQGLFFLNIIAVLDKQDIIYKYQNLFHFRVRLSRGTNKQYIKLTPGPIRPHLNWTVNEIHDFPGRAADIKT